MPVNKTSVMLLILGCMLFFMGYHSIDIAWNLHTVNTETNSSYVDTSLGGSEYNEYQAYRQGVIFLMYGYVLTCFSLLWIAKEEHPSQKWSLKTLFARVAPSRIR